MLRRCRRGDCRPKTHRLGLQVGDVSDHEVDVFGFDSARLDGGDVEACYVGFGEVAAHLRIVFVFMNVE